MEDQKGNFGRTRWTDVVNAGQPGAPGYDIALGRLCDAYRPPLLQFAHGLVPPQEAENLTQGFFAHFIQKNIPGKVSPDKGRFRSFLLASFKNYHVSIWRKEHRAKDIPHALTTSIHEQNDDGLPVVEPVSETVPDNGLDSLWAETIRRRVIKEMARGYAKRGKALFFKRLGLLLMGEELPQGYDTLSVELGMSVGALKTSVSRMREEFRDLFRQEVEDTVFDADEVDAECRYLLGLLFAQGGKH